MEDRMAVLRSTKRFALLILVFQLTVPICLAGVAQPLRSGMQGQGAVLDSKAVDDYVAQFNAQDNEVYIQYVPNADAANFLRGNIPLFECPDKQLEETYYFRWWTFRKHIMETTDGLVITEFRPKVVWAGKHNTIACAAAHQVMEGRWLHDPKYVDDYIKFWYYKGDNNSLMPHLFRYSNWLGNTCWQKYLTDGRKDFLIEQLPAMQAAYKVWTERHATNDDLAWSYDVRDGMEESISGSRTNKNRRATISSYRYSLAKAISDTARLDGQEKLAKEYDSKAETIKEAINKHLWDPKANFFKVMFEDGSFSTARELHGYTPWYFNIPKPGYSIAWKQLMDPQGFYAPYGPTTAEQRHPDFSIEKSYTSHKACRLDGPSWPFATSVTLVAAANLLNDYSQDVIDKEDYFKTLLIYSRSHRITHEDGRVAPWIDESLHPYTGEWITHKRFEIDGFREWKGLWRGKDYNHSTFCDLIITGLLGLRPQPDNTVVVNPLLPEGTWDWFCLDNVKYHGCILTIIWDKTGNRYGRGKGLQVLADGKQIAMSNRLKKVKGKLPLMTKRSIK
jgi:hypothetical protein